MPDSRHSGTSEATWRRRVRVFVCLIALLAISFAHTERPATAAVASGQAAVAVSMPDGADHQSDSLVLRHCAGHAQCSLQAVLPAVAIIHPDGATVAGPAVDEVGADRALTPLRRPPKT